MESAPLDRSAPLARLRPRGPTCGRAALLLAAAGTAAVAFSRAGDRRPAAAPPPPASAAANADEATPLRFREFFELPVGPRGLQATPKLLALEGRPVRIAGYMVREDPPAPGAFILSPLPAALGEADESEADDLPPAVAFVHWDPAPGAPASLPYVPGVIRLVGVLHSGPHEEADGRVSHVRLQLAPGQAAALAREASAATLPPPR